MPRRLVWPLMGVLLLIAWAPAGLAYDVLADPVKMLKSAKRVDFVGTNKFTQEMSTKGAVLRTTPHRSACGLYQRFDIDGRRLQHIRWIWRVDRLHRTADIRTLSTEDFGAMVMFIFGEPSFFNRDVPTLAYVWLHRPDERA